MEIAGKVIEREISEEGLPGKFIDDFTQNVGEISWTQTARMYGGSLCA